MPPVPKAVLISLADQANDEGLCWPSVGNIGRRTCYSERAVQEAIVWLETAKAIRTEPRAGRSTHYHLTPQNYQPPQEAHPTPARGAPRTVIEPSVEPSTDPVAPRRHGARRTNGYHIMYDWTTHKFTGIKDEEVHAWQEAHPAISVLDQIDRAAIWLKANPTRRKSNYERFIVTWLSKAQDRGAPIK